MSDSSSSSKQMRLPTQESPDGDLAITKTSIEYDPWLSQRSGLLAIVDGSPPLVAPHGDTLLRVLFFLVYTGDGRKLLADSTLADPDQTRDALRNALSKLFPDLARDRLEAVIEAHIAGTAYVAAHRAHDGDGKLRWEAAYSQRLLAIMAALHDDAMGHEFSMIW
jgi:hypothetical protein